MIHSEYLKMIGIRCPQGGEHDVRNMEYGIDRSRLMPVRMCVRCGLFDRFIQEVSK